MLHSDQLNEYRQYTGIDVSRSCGFGNPLPVLPVGCLHRAPSHRVERAAAIHFRPPFSVGKNFRIYTRVIAAVLVLDTRAYQQVAEDCGTHHDALAGFRWHRQKDRIGQTGSRFVIHQKLALSGQNAKTGTRCSVDCAGYLHTDPRSSPANGHAIHPERWIRAMFSSNAPSGSRTD